MLTTSGAFFREAEDHEAAFHPDVLARFGMRLGAESSYGAPKPRNGRSWSKDVVITTSFDQDLREIGQRQP